MANSQIVEPPNAGPDPAFVQRELNEVNLQRVIRLTGVVLMIHIIHVVVFWLSTPGTTDPEQLWRKGIIVAHALMAVIVAAFGLTAFFIRRRGVFSGRGPVVLARAVSLGYLLFGASVAVIDQLVTSAISPLLVASTGVAVILVVRPLVSAVNYLCAFALFMLAAPLAQGQSDLLLSATVNSITATGMGFGVSVMLWRNQVHAAQQKWRLSMQQRELEKQNLELVRLATRDQLTGTLNRTQFFAEAESVVASLPQTGRTACLILIDVDHFKAVNDTHGHPTGDSTLQAMARIFAEVLGPKDLLARFGGEEFAVLLKDASLADGAKVAEELRRAIERHSFTGRNEPFGVTISMGVTTTDGSSPDALDLCYRDADEALYQAKASGRNAVRIAPSPHRAAGL